jgi:competence ComEA-like helix-hairpin-helix protein
MKNLKLMLAMAVIVLGLGFSAYAAALTDIGAGAVNINTATVEQLRMLPFVDGQTAQAIVDFRNAHGPFVSIDELKNVKGITRPLLIDLRSHLILKGESNYEPYAGV